MTAAARFLDLWLDAHDVPAVARFWASALDMTIESPVNDAVRLAGEHAWDALWIRPAPPHAQRCAIHVDVSAEHITRFLELGAQVVDASSYPWVVLVGPEGCEICAFPVEGPGPSPGLRRARRILDLVVDTPDPGVAGGVVGGPARRAVPRLRGRRLRMGRARAGGPHRLAGVRPAGRAERGGGLPTASARGDPRSRGAVRPRSHAGPRAPDPAAHRDHAARPAGNEFLVHVAELVVRPDDE
jgi:hypothetical protein